MLTENDTIYSRQTHVTDSLQPFFEARCLQQKMGENKLTEHKLRSGGIRGVCAYLLITARLVLCGEGCLTATLLGSAIWTKWVGVIGPVLIRKYLHNPESCLERMDTLCNFWNAVMPSANLHYYVDCYSLVLQPTFFKSKFLSLFFEWPILS